MKPNHSMRIISLCVVVLCTISCGEYEKLEIEKEAKRLSDSIYRSHRDSLSRFYDEACFARRDSLYRIYFDSLREIEADKIRQLIDR